MAWMVPWYGGSNTNPLCLHWSSHQLDQFQTWLDLGLPAWCQTWLEKLASAEVKYMQTQCKSNHLLQNGTQLSHMNIMNQQNAKCVRPTECNLQPWNS